MGDVICKVCEEPWDAYGLRHGDMAKWQALLLRKGAGCPVCEGEDPDGPLTPTEQLSDPEGALEALGRPTWEEPPPEPIWECEGCGVVAARDSEGRVGWRGGQQVHYSHGRASTYGREYDHEEATAAPPYSIGDDHYCPGCALMCPDCHEVVLLKGEGQPLEVSGYIVDPDDWHRCRAVCESCYYEHEAENNTNNEDE